MTPKLLDEDETTRITPIRRQTLTGLTVNALRERILRGHFPDGEPLRQDAIAEELGVSRIPVREALRQLEAEGLVTFNPHRGAVVSTMSIAEIEELCELRADLESDLVRRAVPHFTKDDDARASDILDAYDLAVKTGDLAAVRPLNWQFHSTLYAPSNRQFTLNIVSKLHQQSDRYMRMLISLAHGESRAKAEHRAIASAMRKRDATRAAHLMREHVLAAGRSLVSFLEEQRATTAAQPARKKAGR